MLCICKKCCCGVELANGVAIFAYFDIILHLIFLPVPGRLYEIYPLAKYAIAWIFIRLIADLVLVLGTKTTRPAFLTMWLIVVGISIVLMVVIASLGIVSFAVGREGGMTWTPNIKTWEEIPNETHILTQAAGYFSMGILATMPFLSTYFWFLVRSLRYRMLMDIAVGFHASRQNIRRNNKISSEVHENTV